MVSLGIDHDTGEFRGEHDPALVAAHGADGLPARALDHCRRGREQRQRPALEVGVAAVRQSHGPRDHRSTSARTSKWNRIEHRLFSHIAMNSRHTPVNLATIVA
jgi:hypothetical protein